MNTPEERKKWPNKWFVVMCNGKHIYASKIEQEANSLANRLEGSLNINSNVVSVITQAMNPTVCHGTFSLHR